VNTTTDGAAGAAAEAETEAAATLRILRGEPTPEELAALLAVIATRAGSGGEAAPQPKVSAWTDRSRYVRPRLGLTPGGWRASAFPQ
jgi:Acyl-CoA carboxylase epsilon subunit